MNLLSALAFLAIGLCIAWILINFRRYKAKFSGPTNRNSGPDIINGMIINKKGKIEPQNKRFY